VEPLVAAAVTIVDMAFSSRRSLHLDSRPGRRRRRKDFETGEEKTYTTGQMFYEQPGATHEVSKNASQTQPARRLAMTFAKKGQR
jgi:hypothetical protein